MGKSLIPLPMFFVSDDLLQASSFGIDFDLVRISVGLEDTPELLARFQQALDAVANVKKS